MRTIASKCLINRPATASARCAASHRSRGPRTRVRFPQDLELVRGRESSANVAGRHFGVGGDGRDLALALNTLISGMESVSSILAEREMFRYDWPVSTGHDVTRSPNRLGHGRRTASCGFRWSPMRKRATRFYAHSASRRSRWEPLHEHLRRVGQRAGQFAEVFGARREAEVAGLLQTSGSTASGSYVVLRDSSLDSTTGHRVPGSR